MKAAELKVKILNEIKEAVCEYIDRPVTEATKKAISEQMEQVIRKFHIIHHIPDLAFTVKEDATDPSRLLILPANDATIEFLQTPNH